MRSVTIAGWLDFEGKDVTTILQGARALIAAAYEEEGCIHYVWTADVLKEGRIWVFEEWASSQTLSAHLAAPAYLDMSTFLGENGLSGADVHKYRVDKKEPVYDEAGVPRGDFFSS